MAKKSAEQYIYDEDFDGAFERFESTNARWKNYWFDVCLQISETCKEVLKKYIINPIDKTIFIIDRTIDKITNKKQRASKFDNKIIIDCDNLYDESAEKCYLFEFYNSENQLVCSKVGTTTRTVIQRLKEELKSDTYKNLDCQMAIIRRVYDCGKYPAEGLESYFRACYIKKFPESFKKNDRFMSELFDFKVADKIANDYFNLEIT